MDVTADADDPHDNIRPRDSLANTLIHFGTEKSPTFRQLVRQLGRSNVIVYVDVQQEADRPEGGSLQFIGEGAGTRWVLATVSTGTSNFAVARQRLVSLTATLGHELQHAREVAKAPVMSRPEDFEAFFRERGVKIRGNVVDTDAARDLGKRVEREIRGFVDDAEGCRCLARDGS